MKLFDGAKIKESIKTSLKNSLLGERTSYTCPIRGHEYTQLELEYAYKKAGGFNNCIESETVKLVDEPDNKYDPKAMAIYAFNVKLGYVPADDTEDIRKLKNKEQPSIRLYYYNKEYRGELTVIYREK